MAGKPGKCPHCDTRFLIPQLEADEPAAPAGPPTAASGVTGGSGVRQGTAGRGESIVFFCPNGHKLNGPPSLRGKLGLCPHCQSKFRIPTEDEAPAPPAPATSASDAGATEIRVSTLAAAASLASQTKSAAASKRPSPPPAPPAPQGPFVDEAPHAEIMEDDDLDVVMGRALESEADPVDEESEGRENGNAWHELPPPVTDTSRWCELFGWLWTQRDMGSVVDLRLKNGQVFQPTWFAPTLSDGQVGVFGVQADDGSYGITALHWDQIERLDVRGCEQLPFDRFE